MAGAGARRAGMIRSRWVGTATGANCRPAAASKVAVIGCVSAAAVIPSAATGYKAMSAPAVAIAPAGPRAHAKEDAVVEVPRAIKADRRTGVWRVVVVAVRADGLNADADDDLRLDCWRHGQAREQRCGSDECLKSMHM